MALVWDSNSQNASGEEESMEKEEEEATGGRAFDMVSLKAHLPHKRKGLSMYFSGKSQSFASVADAKSVGDLEKAELPEAKRRKYMGRRSALVRDLVSWRAAPGATHCGPCVGV